MERSLPWSVRYRRYFHLPGRSYCMSVAIECRNIDVHLLRITLPEPLLTIRRHAVIPRRATPALARAAIGSSAGRPVPLGSTPPPRLCTIGTQSISFLTLIPTMGRGIAAPTFPAISTHPSQPPPSITTTHRIANSIYQHPFHTYTIPH